MYGVLDGASWTGPAHFDFQQGGLPWSCVLVKDLALLTVSVA